MPVQMFAVQRRAVRLAVQLLLLLLQLQGLRRQLLGLLQGLPLGLGLQARFFSPRLGALLLALLFACRAFAADRLDVGLEVIGAVIIVDLVAGLDVLDG